MNRARRRSEGLSLRAQYGILGALAALALFLVGGLLAMSLGSLACSENVIPDTRGADACRLVGDLGDGRWWFLALCPAGALGLALLTRWGRRHTLLAVAAIGLAAALVYAVALSAVSD